MLNITNLSSWYEEGNIILKDLSFNIREKSIVGLLGVNGAGKTTLINTISGIQKMSSIENIQFQGEGISFKDREWKLNRYTVFTEEEAFSYWTFMEYFDFILKLYDVKFDQNRLNKLIDGFGFEKHMKTAIRNLSTGNKKKVFLITGFYLRCKLLILDEPLDGLDFGGAEFLYEEMLRYKKHGTILMSSHIVESIEKTCDHVILLNNGRASMENLEDVDDIRVSLKEWVNED